MRHGRLRFVTSAVYALAACVLSACFTHQPQVELDRLTLDVAPLANNDFPIAVDFVAVEDAELLTLLSGIPAKTWFAEREQYQRDHRRKLAIWSLELVPGQFMESADFPMAGESAAGLLVFASYNTPGVHRLRLDDQRQVWLKFESRDMRLVGDDQR
ncbi:type VI secretion protein [Pseudomonas borbori]